MQLTSHSFVMQKNEKIIEAALFSLIFHEKALKIPRCWYSAKQERISPKNQFELYTVQK
jgi:hypothetical protein